MDTDALISWYQQSRRTMPWREEVSPYRTLVSELMLQQTRVETVIPYFERFMRSFPTEQALAEA
ncbi:MAG TPA: A/G-specific adenine glycosylase, partial [Myxococcota bacterium]|nr:A/G-specific adenine glycosylase [Myxococcota bacterium]